MDFAITQEALSARSARSAERSRKKKSGYPMVARPRFFEPEKPISDDGLRELKIPKIVDSRLRLFHDSSDDIDPPRPRRQ